MTKALRSYPKDDERLHVALRRLKVKMTQPGMGTLAAQAYVEKYGNKTIKRKHTEAEPTSERVQWEAKVERKFKNENKH